MIQVFMGLLILEFGFFALELSMTYMVVVLEESLKATVLDCLSLKISNVMQ